MRRTLSCRASQAAPGSATVGLPGVTYTVMPEIGMIHRHIKVMP
jgi:hypothetical protein